MLRQIQVLCEAGSDRSLQFLVRTLLSLMLVVQGLLIPIALAGDAAVPPKRAALMPLWSPQAQFAGYYVALEKGFYARQGIDLQMRRAGPGYSPVDELRRGETDFAVLWLTTAIRQRAQGMALVNLAQMVQRSSLLLVTRKSSGIDSIVQMGGKKVGLWGGDLSLPIEALFEREGTQVREVPQSQTINLFLRGGIDVASAMWYNEYHTLLNAGIDADELRVFSMESEGLNLPEDGIYMLESGFKADPALAKAFVAASLEGWRYAFAHKEEALDIVINYMHEAQLPANRVHQRWMLARMEDLMQPRDQGNFGQLAVSDYEATATILGNAGVVDQIPVYADFAVRPLANDVIEEAGHDGQTEE